jgi:hypothetical protein
MYNDFYNISCLGILPNTYYTWEYKIWVLMRRELLFFGGFLEFLIYLSSDLDSKIDP